jgi:precorrin-6x reductase
MNADETKMQLIMASSNMSPADALSRLNDPHTCSRIVPKWEPCEQYPETAYTTDELIKMLGEAIGDQNQDQIITLSAVLVHANSSEGGFYTAFMVK